MTCPDCPQAERNPLHPIYTAACQQCRARMLAHSPQRWASVQAGRALPEYRAALVAAFGDRAKEAAGWVKQWADRIIQHQAQQGSTGGREA